MPPTTPKASSTSKKDEEGTHYPVDRRARECYDPRTSTHLLREETERAIPLYLTPGHHLGEYLNGGRNLGG